MRRLGILCAAAVALSACGGSGGGAAIQVAYRESTVSRVVFDDELTTYYACVRATLSPVPADVALVRIVDLSGAFAAGSTSASDLGSGTFEACLNYAPTLTPGVHAGTLRLDLCKDADCAAVHPLSDPDVPYSITVYEVVAGLPLLDAEILADGTPVSGVVSGSTSTARTYQFGIIDGQVLEVNVTNGTLARTTRTVGTPAPGVTPVPPYSLGTFRFRLTLPLGAGTGSVDFTLRTDDGRTIRLAVTVTP